MVHSVNTTPAPREVRIPVGGAFLYGDLVLPPGFHGLVLFAHGSGSGRHCARNRQVAQHLQHAGIATLLFDLLTAQEEQTDLHTREHRFDIPLLTRRMQDVTVWAASQPGLQHAAIGYFGASTGSAAALIAAARLGYQISPLRQVGFYGLDLYNLFSSIQAVLTYLDRLDPQAARRARYRYACFDHAAEDSQAYGHAASFGLKGSCEDEVVQQLREMNRRAAEVTPTPGLERDEAFYAQQNSRPVRNSEEYYRTMFHGRVSSWNLRDSHMAQTLHALDGHLGTGGAPPRIAVWAHNSHLGDASATEMGERGEWNVGQLVRERHADDAMLVGFSTHRGWVTAASDWHEPPQRKRVREGLPGSWEDLFHQTGMPRFLLPPRDDAALRSLVASQRLQRAIGVIYRPDTERQSHYFYTRLAQQFDAVIHIDNTSAVEPLDVGPVWIDGEAPETFPSGI